MYGQSYGNYERGIAQAIADELTARGLVINNGASTSQEQRQYSENFTQAYLDSSNQLLVVHNLNAHPASVVVIDESGERINPDNIIDLDTNALRIDLTSFAPIPGAYKVIVSL